VLDAHTIYALAALVSAATPLARPDRPARALATAGGTASRA